MLTPQQIEVRHRTTAQHPSSLATTSSSESDSADISSSSSSDSSYDNKKDIVKKYKKKNCLQSILTFFNIFMALTASGGATATRAMRKRQCIVSSFLALVGILVMTEFLGKPAYQLADDLFPAEHSAEDLVMEHQRMKLLSSNEEQKVFDMVLPKKPKKRWWWPFGRKEKNDYPLFGFMDEVNTSQYLRPAGYMSLDQTHREGRYHMGAWIFVTDVTGDKVLLLERGPQLVTCPNSWGVVGEHTYRDETPLETVQRALVEEIWGGSNDTYVDSIQFIRNMTEFPVLYLKDYGVINHTTTDNGDNILDKGGDDAKTNKAAGVAVKRPPHRIDRQLTYLYEVRMTEEADDLKLKFDDEVQEYQWISLERFRLWLQIDGNHNNFKSFCHPTMTRLNRFCLDRLKYLREKDCAELKQFDLWSSRGAAEARVISCASLP